MVTIPLYPVAKNVLSPLISMAWPFGFSNGFERPPEYDSPDDAAEDRGTIIINAIIIIAGRKELDKRPNRIFAPIDCTPLGLKTSWLKYALNCCFSLLARLVGRYLFRLIDEGSIGRAQYAL